MRYAADRIPAREPESDSSGGITTSSAGSARSDVSRPSMMRPASMLITPAATSTGTDSRTMRRSTVRCVRQPATRHTSRTTAHRTAEHRRHPVRLATSAVARNRLGSVTMSAAAVTTGAVDVVDVPVAADAGRRGPRW